MDYVTSVEFFIHLKPRICEECVISDYHAINNAQSKKI